MDPSLAKVLAEVLMLHRWAGEGPGSLARIYGLSHGVESVIEEEKQRCISEGTQDKIEDMLEDVEQGKQSANGTAIKDRLRREGIDERDARVIMRLCALQGRFGEGVEKIASGGGSAFSSLLSDRSSCADWSGAIHQVELIDESENTKSFVVSTPFIPRVGEVIETHKGSPMVVTDVSYFVLPVEDNLAGRHPQRTLQPQVMMRPLEATEESGES